MKRRWTITLLVILLAAAGVGLFKYWPRTIDDDQCSALYRSYLHCPGIQSTYIKGKRLNDTLRIDLTLLQATPKDGRSCKKTSTSPSPTVPPPPCWNKATPTSSSASSTTTANPKPTPHAPTPSTSWPHHARCNASAYSMPAPPNKSMPSSTTISTNCQHANQFAKSLKSLSVEKFIRLATYQHPTYQHINTITR